MISDRLKRISAISGLALLASVNALARQQKPVVPIVPAAKDEQKQRNVKIAYSGLHIDEAKQTVDYQDIEMVDVDEETLFKTKHLLVNRKKDVQTAASETQISIVDKQADISADQGVLHYAKSQRLAILTGGVTITVKPKDEPANPAAPASTSAKKEGVKTPDPEKSDDASVDSARKYPATISCDKVEYKYAKTEKHGLLTGNFKVVQKLADKTRTLTAEKAEWFGLEDRVLLYGPVHVEDTKGMKVDSPGNVELFVKEGAERVVMKAGKGQFAVDDEDEPAPNPGDKTKPDTKKPAVAAVPGKPKS